MLIPTQQNLIRIGNLLTDEEEGKIKNKKHVFLLCKNKDKTKNK